MKKIILTSLIITLSCVVFCQINLNKKNIFVESFCKAGDKYTYSNTYEKIIIDKHDTLVNEKTLYETEISIIGSSDTSYTIQWLNSNIETNSTNEAWKLLMKVTKNLKLVFVLNKHGTFNSISNWKEIQDSIWNRINNLPTIEMSMSGAQHLVELVKVLYDSKESIEAGTISHLLQYFKFHGIQLQYKKLYETTLFSNSLMTEKPIESKTYILLDSIDFKKKYFHIIANELSNQGQLAEALKEYYKKKYGLGELPTSVETDFSNCSETTITESKFNCDGILISSKLSQTLNTQESKRVEINTINIE